MEWHTFCLNWGSLPPKLSGIQFFQIVVIGLIGMIFRVDVLIGFLKLCVLGLLLVLFFPYGDSLFRVLLHKVLIKAGVLSFYLYHCWLFLFVLFFFIIINAIVRFL